MMAGRFQGVHGSAPPVGLIRHIGLMGLNLEVPCVPLVPFVAAERRAALPKLLATVTARSPSSSRQQLKNKSLQVFRLRKMGQDRVIQWLGQRFDPAEVPFGIDAGVNHDIGKSGLADVV
jgi:hypothetical protein